LARKEHCSITPGACRSSSFRPRGCLQHAENGRSRSNHTQSDPWNPPAQLRRTTVTIQPVSIPFHLHEIAKTSQLPRRRVARALVTKCCQASSTTLYTWAGPCPRLQQTDNMCQPPNFSGQTSPIHNPNATPANKCDIRPEPPCKETGPAGTNPSAPQVSSSPSWSSRTHS
jgi:hypothetical protein